MSPSAKRAVPPTGLQGVPAGSAGVASRLTAATVSMLPGAGSSLRHLCQFPKDLDSMSTHSRLSQASLSAGKNAMDVFEKCDLVKCLAGDPQMVQEKSNLKKAGTSATRQKQLEKADKLEQHKLLMELAMQLAVPHIFSVSWPAVQDAVKALKGVTDWGEKLPKFAYAQLVGRFALEHAPPHSAVFNEHNFWEVLATGAADVQKSEYNTSSPKMWSSTFDFDGSDLVNECVPVIMATILYGLIIPAMKMKALGKKQIVTYARQSLRHFAKYPDTVREQTAVKLFISQLKTLLLLLDELPFQLGAQLSDVEAAQVVKPLKCRFTFELIGQNDYEVTRVSWTRCRVRCSLNKSTGHLLRKLSMISTTSRLWRKAFF